MSIVKKKKSPAKRTRRTPEEARAAALAAARQRLLSDGPNAVTLQAVAADLGMGHTNLIHHFGSASGLQAALMTQMTRELTQALEQAVVRFRVGHANAEDLVDLVFEVFDAGGAGRLAAWISLSGETDQLTAIGEVVRNYLRNIEAGARSGDDDVHRRVTSASLLVTLAACGDAVIGESLGSMMGRERKAMRKVIAALLPVVLGTGVGATDGRSKVRKTKV